MGLVCRYGMGHVDGEHPVSALLFAMGISDVRGLIVAVSRKGITVRLHVTRTFMLVMSLDTRLHRPLAWRGADGSWLAQLGPVFFARWVGGRTTVWERREIPAAK